ncbi:MAG: YdeI/OmpD-associated family protein [Bacteroidetes bacterium]|nr:YdeI/OmpD-associated family protein [Bacteroidota bacterium]
MKDEPIAFGKFKKLPKSYQNYYSKWVCSAKSPETKSRPIGIVINVVLNDQTLAEMLKANRELKIK